MKIPNFIFLASPHNVAKAYLVAMLELGLIPERIIFTEFSQPPVSKPVHRQLKSISPIKMLRRLIQQVAPTPGAPASKGDAIYEHVVDFVIKQSDLPAVEFFTSTEELLERHRLPYERIQIASLNDPEFISLISRAPQTVALYVEGGILRKPVLSTHVRFLHIHPGIVPFVKGSTCLLWSALVRKKVGMSCFYMNEGIDAGDVILTREYPIPEISVPAHLMGPQYAETRYLALEDYLGAAYRADVLRALLKQQPDPAQWQPQPQDPASGTVYFHPHTLLRDKAVNKFFTGAL